MNIKAATLFVVSSFIVLPAWSSPVNINQAPAETIALSLSGIGKYKAEAIVEYRSKNGFFKKATDIINVRGIGPATYEKNKQDILVK